MKYDYDMTNKVLEDVKNQPSGLQGKINKYLELLTEKGQALKKPFVDSIKSYKNLYELRPSHGNLEYRMIFFWKQKTAYFIHTFFEKGKKRKNQREYKTAAAIKKIAERNI